MNAISYVFAGLWLMLIPAAITFAGDSWLQSFAEIYTEPNRVWFANDRWAVLYEPSFVGQLETYPRESVTLLSSPPRSAEARIDSDLYRFNGRLLLRVRHDSTTTLSLPPPTSDALGILGKLGAKSANPLDVDETIGPLIAHDGRLWFGVRLAEKAGTVATGGVGWFDPATDRFGRNYNPSLAGFRAVWMAATGDTLRILFEKTSDGKRTATALISVDAPSGGLTFHSLAAVGVPGRVVTAIETWGDTLLLATDQAVSVWKPRRKPLVWTSRAYTATKIRWLYLKTFPNGDPQASEPVRWIPLKSNTPAEVKAKVGEWLQLVSPLSLEGFVAEATWNRHGVLWSQRDWSCGDSLCFARVRVPLRDVMVEADFANTAFTYLDRTRDGVKVSFRAAWAREVDLTPVMISP